MRTGTMIIVIAFLVQAHTKELASNDDAHDATDQMVEKLIDKLVGTSAMLPTGTRQTPLLQQRPLKNAYAVKQPTRLSSLRPQSLPSRHHFQLLKSKYEAQKPSTLLTRASGRAAGAGGKEVDVRADGKEVDVTGQTFNLVKNIVGAGVLSLPAGVAAIGGDANLLLPAVTTVAIMGAFSAYTFFSIGRSCQLTNSTTYADAWQKAANGPKWMATVVGLAAPILGCVAYAIIIGDMFSSLAKGGVLGPLGASALATDRRSWILGLTAVVLYPLCCLKDLSALAVTSLLGTLAVAFTGAFMMLRFFDGSCLVGGAFRTALPTLPAFSTGGSLVGACQTFLSRPESFILFSMLGMAFYAHVNAPIYFNEAGRDLSKFKKITLLGFGGALLLNVLFMVSGFLTFGKSCAGVILNSYANTDPLASVARVLLGVAVVFTYPIVFAGHKPVTKSILSGLGIKDGLFLNQMLTTIPVAFITTLALLISNAGFMSAFKGSICGATQIYIFPALMFLLSALPAKKSMGEKGLNVGLTGVGGLLGVFGVYQSLKKYVFC